MKDPDAGNWQRTSPAAIVLFFVTNVRVFTQNLWQFLPPIFAFLVAYEGGLASKVSFGVGGLVLALMTGSLLNWLFFRYQILNDSIVIRSGVFKKKQIDIKFDRIQGINTQQNPLYRLLDLVTVSFDTAGSSGTEGNLPAVTRECAAVLRENIGTRKADPENEDDLPVTAIQSLLKLDWRDMLRLAAADPRPLIILALGGPLLEVLVENLELTMDSMGLTKFDSLQPEAGIGTLMVVSIILATLLLLILTVAYYARAGACLRARNTRWISIRSRRFSCDKGLFSAGFDVLR